MRISHPFAAQALDPTDCVWADWSPWTDCADCGVFSSRHRHRSVVVNASTGGTTCQGDADETEACYVACAGSAAPGASKNSSSRVDARVLLVAGVAGVLLGCALLAGLRFGAPERSDAAGYGDPGPDDGAGVELQAIPEDSEPI